MKDNKYVWVTSIGFLALAMVVGLAGSASAQIPISVPDIFKVKKTKKEPVGQPLPPTTTRTATPDEKQVAAAPQESLWMTGMIEDAQKVQKDIDEFDPQKKVWLVSPNNFDILMRAVSQKTRTKWLKDANALDKVRKTPNNRLDAAFDALADAASKKIPTYKSKLNEFKFRNPTEEKLMKSILEHIADYKVFSGGLAQTSWLIAKDNYGLPIRRFKSGALYLKDVTADHPYCYLTYINIMQDYSGGGTYGDGYAEFIKDELVGCP